MRRASDNKITVRAVIIKRGRKKDRTSAIEAVITNKRIILGVLRYFLIGFYDISLIFEILAIVVF